MNLGLYMQMSHDPGSHDSDPGSQEKSMKKSCVSFEAECSIRMWAVIPYAQGMLLTWTLLYKRLPRSLKLDT